MEGNEKEIAPNGERRKGATFFYDPRSRLQTGLQPLQHRLAPLFLSLTFEKSTEKKTRIVRLPNNKLASNRPRASTYSSLPPSISCPFSSPMSTLLLSSFLFPCVSSQKASSSSSSSSSSVQNVAVNGGRGEEEDERGGRVPKRGRKRTEKKKKKGLCCKGQEGGRRRRKRRVRSKNLPPFSSEPPPPSFFGLLGDKSSPPRDITRQFMSSSSMRGGEGQGAARCAEYTV